MCGLELKMGSGERTRARVSRSGCAVCTHARSLSGKVTHSHTLAPTSGEAQGRRHEWRRNSRPARRRRQWCSLASGVARIDWGCAQSPRPLYWSRKVGRHLDCSQIFRWALFRPRRSLRGPRPTGKTPAGPAESGPAAAPTRGRRRRRRPRCVSVGLASSRSQARDSARLFSAAAARASRTSVGRPGPRLSSVSIHFRCGTGPGRAFKGRGGRPLELDVRTLRPS